MKAKVLALVVLAFFTLQSHAGLLGSESFLAFSATHETPLNSGGIRNQDYGTITSQFDGATATIGHSNFALDAVKFTFTVDLSGMDGIANNISPADQNSVSFAHLVNHQTTVNGKSDSGPTFYGYAVSMTGGQMGYVVHEPLPASGTDDLLFSLTLGDDLSVFLDSFAGSTSMRSTLTSGVPTEFFSSDLSLTASVEYFGELVTPPPASVSEPGTLALLGLGLAGLVVTRRSIRT